MTLERSEFNHSQSQDSQESEDRMYFIIILIVFIIMFVIVLVIVCVIVIVIGIIKLLL